MSHPAVSAIIPVHDGRDLLARALRSVLGQSRPPDEIIVVDDGSQDGSGALARAFAGVTCLELPHQGQAAALNHGVAAARGEYLAFLDCDDEWLPDKLARQLARFDADGSLEAVFGHAQQIVDMRGHAVGAPASFVARLPSAMLIRRAALARVGPFNPGLRLGMVIEWYTRARDAGLREAVVPEVAYRRHIHGANMGIRHARERDEYAVMLKQVLDRRRSSKGA